jgi:hypothetical protein
MHAQVGLHSVPTHTELPELLLLLLPDLQQQQPSTLRLSNSSQHLQHGEEALLQTCLATALAHAH